MMMRYATVILGAYVISMVTLSPVMLIATALRITVEWNLVVRMIGWGAVSVVAASIMVQLA